jgi:hypothetical protein
MLQQLNAFSTQYGGLLGLAGLALAVFGVAYGFYARNNPKPSKYKLIFKVFAPETVSDALIRAVTRRKRVKPFTCHVDIWNSGSEPITGGVIREPLRVGVQERDGQELVSAEVLRESHPGVSAIRAEVTGLSARIDWAHFDPGMCARIELRTKLPLAGTELTVFGSGLRLEIVRARRFDDPSTLLGIASRSLLIGVGVLTFAATAGALLGWVSGYGLAMIIWVALSIPIALALLLLGGFSAGVGLGLHAVLGWVFNARSPIEHTDGMPPSHEQLVRSLRSQQLALDRMEMEHYERENHLRYLRETGQALRVKDEKA